MGGFEAVLETKADKLSSLLDNEEMEARCADSGSSHLILRTRKEIYLPSILSLPPLTLSSLLTI